MAFQNGPKTGEMPADAADRVRGSLPTPEECVARSSIRFLNPEDPAAHVVDAFLSLERAIQLQEGLWQECLRIARVATAVNQIAEHAVTELSKT